MNKSINILVAATAFTMNVLGCDTESVRNQPPQTMLTDDADELLELQSQQHTLITDATALDSYVGQLVTIRGEVSNSKIPTILGVDVQSNNPDLRGQFAEATGVLQRHVVTPEEIATANFAHRGAGIFYRLKDQDSDYEAAVRPVSP